MNVKEKLERCKAMVDGIATHEDEDAAVRHAMLEELELHIAEQRNNMDARVAERVAKLNKD